MLVQALKVKVLAACLMSAPAKDLRGTPDLSNRQPVQIRPRSSKFESVTGFRLKPGEGPVKVTIQVKRVKKGAGKP